MTLIKSKSYALPLCVRPFIFLLFQRLENCTIGRFIWPQPFCCRCRCHYNKTKNIDVCLYNLCWCVCLFVCLFAFLSSLPFYFESVLIFVVYITWYKGPFKVKWTGGGGGGVVVAFCRIAHTFFFALVNILHSRVFLSPLWHKKMNFSLFWIRWKCMSMSSGWP